MEATCLPVGIVADLSPSEGFVPLGPEDVLVVATDGFSEATNPDQSLFGYERLLRLVDELAQAPAVMLADELFAAVDRFSAGRPQDDDQTLMILKGVDL